MHLLARACWCSRTGDSTGTGSCPRSRRPARLLMARAKPPAPPVWSSARRVVPVPPGGLDGTDHRRHRTTGADGAAAALPVHHHPDRPPPLPRRSPRAALPRTREIETAFSALRHTLLGGRVLRSGDPPGMSRSCGPCSPSTSCCAWQWSPPPKPGPAPTPTGPASPPPWKQPATGHQRPRHLPPRPARPGRRHRPRRPGHLLPARRHRYSARKVKCPTSRYLSRDDADAPARRRHRDQRHPHHPAAGPTLKPAAPPQSPKTPPGPCLLSSLPGGSVSPPG